MNTAHKRPESKQHASPPCGLDMSVSLAAPWFEGLGRIGIWQRFDAAVSLDAKILPHDCIYIQLL